MATAKGSIVLTGFMGTGKSSVGMALAHKLGLEFVDTDALLVSQYGPLDQIVQTHGEDRFRELERDVIAHAVAQPGRVIATGGATVLDPQSANALASAGLIYCLVAAPQEIARRMDALSGTPESSSGDTDTMTTDTMTRVTSLLTERLPAYSQFPQIRTDGRAPEAIANEIANDAANRGLVKLGKEKKERTSNQSALKIGLVVFVLVALVAGAVVYFTSGGGEERIAVRDVSPPSPDLPAGAPEGDEFIDIVLVNEPSREAEERIQAWFGFQRGGEFGFEGFGEQLVQGSAVHAISVGSRLGTIDVYQWESVTNFPGERPQELRCTGEFTRDGRGGGQNCFPTQFDQQGTSLSWGGIENGRQWLSTISVVNAPDDALWMATELRGGFVVVSSVVGGYGFAEWDGADGEPLRVTLFDADLDEVWSERMGF